MNINLHVERLVLDGLSMTNADDAAIQGAVESELVRLLSEESLPRMSGGAVKNISGGEIQLGTENDPARTGQQIARVVHAALSSPRTNANLGGRSR